MDALGDRIFSLEGAGLRLGSREGLGIPAGSTAGGTVSFLPRSGTHGDNESTFELEMSQIGFSVHRLEVIPLGKVESNPQPIPALLSVLRWESDISGVWGH